MIKTRPVAWRCGNHQVTDVPWSHHCTHDASIFSLARGWQTAGRLQQPENVRASVSQKARPAELLAPPEVPAQPRLGPPWPSSPPTSLNLKHQWGCSQTTNYLLRSRSLLLGPTRNANQTRPCFPTRMRQAMPSPNPKSAGVRRRSAAIQRSKRWL